MTSRATILRMTAASRSSLPTPDEQARTAAIHQECFERDVDWFNRLLARSNRIAAMMMDGGRDA